MIAWYMKVLRQWNDFKGRARRSEYWYFTLTYAIIYIAMYALIFGALALGDIGHIIAPIISIVLLIYALAMLVPAIAVSIRRLHDVGKNAWWLLIAFVPFVGGLVLLYFFVLDSVPETNEWGPSPKLTSAAFVAP